jgi:hypothetical protein
MKPLRFIHVFFGVAAIAILSTLAWVAYESARSHKESLRIDKTQNALEERLAAYLRANGHYPASLQMLAFTNPPEDNRLLADVRRITYRQTASGYELLCRGANGYIDKRVVSNQMFTGK